MLARENISIINMGSMNGIGGGLYSVTYAVSKNGLVGLTLNNVWLYAASGIGCNAICPGGINTNITTSIDMHEEAMSEVRLTGRAHAFKYLIPVLQEPMDFAKMAFFLRSDESRYFNDAVITVPDGRLAANCT